MKGDMYMTEPRSKRMTARAQFRKGLLSILTALIMTMPVGAWAGLEGALASPNGVTLNWTAPGDDGNTGSASFYDIRYSTSPITDGNWEASDQASGEPDPQVAGSTESFAVTGLSPSTTYYFAIKTGDEVPNWSPLSNVISVATDAEQDAPSVLDDLQVTNSTDSSLTLTWTATGDDGSNGTASQYDIRYSTSTINAGNWDAATQVQGEPAPQVAGSEESFTVFGLNESSTYYFAVNVADEVPNWSGLSNITSSATDNEITPPAAPTDLIALNPTGSSIELLWTATGDDGYSGTASYYDIRFSTAPINAGNWDNATHVANEPTPQASGAEESFVITGLSHSTEYYFALKVGDEVFNWSERSNEATASTSDQTAPAAIVDLEVLVE